VAGALLVLAVPVSAGLVLLQATRLSELSFRAVGLTGVAPLVAAAVALVATAAALVVAASAPGPAGAPPVALLAVVPWAVVATSVVPTLRSAVAPERSRDGAPVDVLVQNLWYQHPDPSRAATVVLGADADVVVLVELTPAHERALVDAGVDRHYPHQLRRPAAFGDGIAVLSRFPLEGSADLGLFSPSIRTTLRVGGRAVELLAVHPVAPSDRWGLPRWRADLDVLSRRAAAAGPDLIVAGDLNATFAHPRFRHLVGAGGLREAHRVAGTGAGLTWPAGHRLVPPVMRLDHVLVGAAIGVERAEVVRGAGSDHLGVAARLRVPPP
jgi:endonuclease/exonuclease/phosphatase (EEP) superfamily protein YafD